MVSTKNRLIKITQKELRDLYLKKITKVQGITLIPIDNRQNYAEFCRKIIQKTPKQMRAYWAKELYDGTKVPPKMKNDAQIKHAIKNNRYIISYASHKLTGKIIFTIYK